MVFKFAVCCVALALLNACFSSVQPVDKASSTALAFSPSDDARFSNEVMNVAPFLPANQVNRQEQCKVANADAGFKTSSEVDYAEYGRALKLSMTP